MKSNNKTDWPMMFFVGRTMLGYTDKEIWKLTPRIYNAALLAYNWCNMDSKERRARGADLEAGGYINQEGISVAFADNFG